ncbi:MAG: Ref family recombination enhancement nuclease [Kangiellaceae bacterium]|jgi:hypothetical protein|nr:Ref family recombination enhancement nuclease [Kangiellaceae bacterium]
MKGRNPTKAEKTHMDAVRALGCIVCRIEYGGYRDAAIHHCDGKTKPGAHMKVLPLCYEHHQGGSDSPPFISRHPYKARFEAAYGTEAELMERTAELLA